MSSGPSEGVIFTMLHQSVQTCMCLMSLTEKEAGVEKESGRGREAGQL